MNELEFLDELLKGNGSVIIDNNIYMLNNSAIELYGKPELSENEVQRLKAIIMACNILYNRTDMTIQVIEDGFYDVLLEKYKKYDPNFQVGSAIVDFKNLQKNEIHQELEKPMRMIVPVERDEIHQKMYDDINKSRLDYIDKRDFCEIPIRLINSDISKRTHDTEHNHPDLVGTLDKAKFVFSYEAEQAGVLNDPNVVVLERDFFGDHVKKGILDPNRIINVICELKYDGISVEADCNFSIQSARTRGDTGIGKASDLTPLLQGYIFKHADCMIGEKPVGVKFEAIMTKTNLATFNMLRGKDYKNCRTAIVGLFGASDAYQFRDLITLIPLAVDRNDVPAITNRLEEVEFLNKVFISHGEPLRYCILQGKLREILYMIKAFWDESKLARDHLNFMYDGIVVSYLDEDIRRRLGRVNYINKYSMAVKFDPLEAQTIFRGYSYEIGQNGQITPMIHYDPVCFLGTIHTKSTGSSYERFKNLALKHGDYVNIKYVNDVMPYVTKLDCDHNRNNNNPLEEFPTECPCCRTRLIITDSGKTAICPNIECPARSLQRMVNMMAKLNLKGFADASFEQLNVAHLADLVKLTREQMVNKIGVADGNNLYSSLQSLKTNPLPDYIIMGSLGFSGIASKKWKSILQKITVKELYGNFKSRNFNDFQVFVYSVIKQEATANIIANEFKFFERDVQEILSWNNLVDSFGSGSDSKLQIRFTGCRNKQLSELLLNNGYDADDSSSVTKKTDILLVPYDGFRSNKTDKVSDSCMIIPIDRFIANMNEILNENIVK
jgi:NAD-dependent DNA ligase